MTKATILIIKTGTALAEMRPQYGDFEDWFMQALGPQRFNWQVTAVDQGEALPAHAALKNYGGVIITGSGAMVSHRLDWSERTADWLVDVVYHNLIPVLGVCYGHQLLAHALGGKVGPNPNGRRMGTRELIIRAADDPLIGWLAPRARVHVTHQEVVLERPLGTRILAHTEGDENHVLHHGGRCWGVQFHPEFTGDIMRYYIQARADALAAEGMDSQALLAAVEETPDGQRVLDEFAEYCR